MNVIIIVKNVLHQKQIVLLVKEQIDLLLILLVNVIMDILIME